MIIFFSLIKYMFINTIIVTVIFANNSYFDTFIFDESLKQQLPGLERLTAVLLSRGNFQQLAQGRL